MGRNGYDEKRIEMQENIGTSYKFKIDE